jgi:hypothetical protein
MDSVLTAFRQRPPLNTAPDRTVAVVFDGRAAARNGVLAAAATALSGAWRGGGPGCGAAESASLDFCDRGPRAVPTSNGRVTVVPATAPIGPTVSNRITAAGRHVDGLDLESAAQLLRLLRSGGRGDV